MLLFPKYLGHLAMNIWTENTLVQTPPCDRFKIPDWPGLPILTQFRQTLRTALLAVFAVMLHIVEGDKGVIQRLRPKDLSTQLQNIQVLQNGNH